MRGTFLRGFHSDQAARMHLSHSPFCSIPVFLHMTAHIRMMFHFFHPFVVYLV
ncbi:hypothetical protein N399_12970 [Bacillus licheniformis CG-B52]|nr:hypothetical protein N399_12970 [Bacillus licheniformis CG-B52]KUL10904.1 hypothetical protein LI17339_13050 [Bacillus licheniformis LMG 17339]